MHTCDLMVSSHGCKALCKALLNLFSRTEELGKMEVVVQQNIGLCGKRRASETSHILFRGGYMDG